MSHFVDCKFFDYDLIGLYFDYLTVCFYILRVDKKINFDQNLGDLIENWFRAF